MIQWSQRKAVGVAVHGCFVSNGEGPSVQRENMNDDIHPQPITGPHIASADLASKPDLFRGSLFCLWIVVCWLAAIVLLDVTLILMDPILFFFVFLPLCGYAVVQSKRWLAPDEIEYWKGEAKRKKADDWLKNQPQGPLPGHVASTVPDSIKKA